jgi:nucleotide-binding universal stress UspA family protein
MEVDKILVYADGSEEALAAMKYAVYMAKNYQLELYGINVVNTRALSDLVNAKIFLQMEQEEYLADMQNDARKHLDELVYMAQRKGVMVHPVVEEGEIYRCVMNVVKEESISMVVIGELATVRSKRDEQNSDMERLLRNVPCSVLVVKDAKRVDILYNSL